MEETNPTPPLLPAQDLNPTVSLKERILKYKIFIGIMVLMIILLPLVYLATRQLVRKSQPIQTAPMAAATPSLPANSEFNLIYGVLTKDSAVVKSYNLKTGEATIAATLPTNIKKIMPIKNNQLLFINQTNSSDQGQEIAVYNPITQKTTTILKTAPGFAIDDFVISANQQFLATWEVKLTDQALAGGYSAVYSFDLTKPSEGKHLIYSENEVSDSKQLFHYPSAISNLGEVFCDSFLPNSGAGWAYGMSVSDFKGTQKTDLTNMKNGTYGTKPVLSPDGNFLAFSGYDGEKGDGTTINKGFREALLNPNTLELLDLKTRQRTKLNVPNQLVYLNVSWDKTTNNLIYSGLSADIKLIGTYLYNLQTNSYQKIFMQGSDNKQVAATLPNNQLLVAVPDISITNTANLGETYTTSYQSFAIYDIATKKETTLNIEEPLIQMISFSTKMSDSVLGAQLVLGGRQLQIKDLKLAPKPSLGSARSCLNNTCNVGPGGSTVPGGSYIPPANPAPVASTGSQSWGGSCEDLSAAYCQNLGVPDSAFNNCYNHTFDTRSACYISPLYLYGPTGKSVNVKINTPISNSNLNDSGNFNLVLAGNGQFRFGAQLYSNLTFDYHPALKKVSPPPYGTVVATKNLAATLQYYGQRLGLTNPEIEDLIKSNRQVTTPYVLVSYFDKETSVKLLPISFNPRPDTYQNIVFYLKPLPSEPNYQLSPPTFPNIVSRGEFTVIEISTFIDK